MSNTAPGAPTQSSDKPSDTFKAVATGSDFEMVVLEGIRGGLSDDIESRIEVLWAEEEARLGKVLFNGSLFSATAITPTRLEGHFVPYKHFVAQMRDPSLADAVGIYAVAVTGVTRSADGSKILLGKRSETVLQYPGEYELVPSGGVDADSIQDGHVDFMEQLYRELEEEAGITKNQVLSSAPTKLVYDSKLRIWELCCDVVVDASVALQARPEEHSELVWVPAEEAADFCLQRPTVEMTRYLLAQLY